MFDLFLFTLNVEGGIYQSELPGLLAAAAPKKCARPRSEDTLFILLNFTSSGKMAQPALNDLLHKAQNAYFNFSGTTTSALKAAAEQVNAVLVEHNLRARAESDRRTARLSMAAVRGEQVYIAHAGSGHAFILGNDQVHDLWDDNGINPRGLGMNRSVTVRFFSAVVKSGDSLVLSPQSPPMWSDKALLGTSQLTLESLRRRLLNQAEPELQAVVVRFQEGKGQLHRLRVRTGAPAAAEGSTPAQKPSEAITPEEKLPGAVPSIPVAQAETVKPEASTERIELPDVEKIFEPPAAPAGDSDTAQTEKPVEEKEAVPVQSARMQPVRPMRPMVRPLGSTAQGAEKASPGVPTEKGESFTRKLANLFLGARQGKQKFGDGMRTITSRVLPGRVIPKPTISPALMLFIAIAVPAMVVAVAATVYMRNGLAEQRQIYLAKAQQTANQATVQTDPVLQRSELENALGYLEQANQYGTSEESQILREQIQGKLDDLDGVTRLELFPALKDGLSASTRITRMAVADENVYLLDASQNLILHLKRINNDKQYRYELNRGFSCSSAGSPTVDIFPITFQIDINAAVVSLDDSGWLIYCSIREVKSWTIELPPPSGGWGKITAADIYQESLYVLDTSAEKANVWRYSKNTQGYWENPRAYFQDAITTLEDVIDLAVYEGSLYLLRSNGKITKCDYDGYAEQPATCQKDPVNYADVKGGSGPVIFNFDQAAFKQIETVNQPDAALYVLDIHGPTVLRFGPEIENLFGQLRPRVDADYTQPDVPVSAFVVNDELPRYILVAYDDLLYYAALK